MKFFSSLVVLFLLWITLVFYQTSNLTKSSQWVDDVYVKKIKIANKIETKKVLIVAGSNAMFGCDSKLLSTFFQLPVVNFGVNAGVYLPYILFKAKQVIKKGDIVLMPLEYPMYNYNGIPNDQMIDTIFSRDMEAFFTLSFKEQFYMIWNITFKRVYEGYIAKGGKKVKAGLYGAHNINQQGDQIKTEKKYGAAYKKELDGHKANSYGKGYGANSLGWEYLEQFVKWCKDREVEVVFVPSTMMYFDEYRDNKNERWFYENLAGEVRKRGWEFVGDTYEYMYEKEYYFNTDFHLTSKGRERRTAQLIKDLKQLF